MDLERYSKFKQKIKDEDISSLINAINNYNVEEIINIIEKLGTKPTAHLLHDK